MSDQFDVVVVGAGMAGLSAAALCAQDGMSVMVLEQHYRVGGCAGDFFQHGYRFPAGATMALGFGLGGLNHWLYDRLGLKPRLLSVDPAIQIHLPDRRVDLHQSPQELVDELSHSFPDPGIRRFWQQVAQLGGICYRLAGRRPPLPPGSLGDARDLLAALRPEVLQLVPKLGLTVGSLLRHHRADGREHTALIDNLLLISLQCKADECAGIPGVLGLDIYRHGAWAVEGGMGQLATLLRSAVVNMGGKVQTRTAVTGLIPPPNRAAPWLIKTQGGDTIRATTVIANTTADMLSKLLGERAPTRLTEGSKKLTPDWGAFMLYLVVSEQDLPTGTGAAYHQVLHSYDADPAECNSAFVSVGDPTHATRPGVRIITASTHTRTARWAGLDASAYAAQKTEYEEQMLARVGSVFPGAVRAPICRFSATPRTYAYYTGRPEGWVGGYPVTPSHTLLRSPSRRTGLPRLVMAGDTVYPGQGMGTVLSAYLAWQDCRENRLVN